MAGLFFLSLAAVHFIGGLVAAWMILGPSANRPMAFLVAFGGLAVASAGWVLARTAVRSWRERALSRSKR